MKSEYKSKSTTKRVVLKKKPRIPLILRLKKLRKKFISALQELKESKICD